VPKPAIVSLGFVHFKNSVDGRAMYKLMVKLRAYQIIKSTHVAGISGFITSISVLVNGTKFLQEIK
jgi:hypothetical protein